MSLQQNTELTEATANHVIPEYGETEPIDPEDFPDAARQIIENQINKGTGDRLQIEWLPDGQVKLHATSYVGIVSLPGGLTVEIRPKIEETDLLRVLQYSQGVQADTIAEETELTQGSEFIRALATLFESELADVIQRGLVQEYRRYSDTEEHVRGRIKVQRQLQRHGPQPTQFECTYDTLTQDTILNQAVLHATDLLLRIVTDQQTGNSLKRHKQVLQRAVELRPVRSAELDRIELSRLANYYDDLFRLTKLILDGVYVDNLRTGTRGSFSLLVNMNTIFENVLERGIRDVFAETPVTIQPQVNSENLLWGGSRSIQIQPDILAVSEDEPVFVGDAKWKRDTKRSREPSNSDIYQLLSYQVAYDVPGIIFYPAQNKRVESRYQSQLEDDLSLVEVPLKPADGKSYAKTVRDALSSVPLSIVGSGESLDSGDLR